MSADSIVLIKTLDGAWYVHQIHGVLFLSWVRKADRRQALRFSRDQAEKILPILQQLSDVPLEIEGSFRVVEGKHFGRDGCV